MKGSDLLDKLENLDPNLVAGAAEPPAERVRRRDHQWGAWVAAAACIVAIALPLALSYLINGVAPVIEYGPGSKQGSTSHQPSPQSEGAEGGSGLGNAQKGANRGEGEADGPTANYATSPEISIVGYKDYVTWAKYTLDEQYCSAYPDGLPAEEYFKYNKQEPESGDRLTSAAWDDSLLDKYSSYPMITRARYKTASADGTTASPYEVMNTFAERIFMCLPSCAWPPTVEIKCAEDGSGLCLVYISTASEFGIDANGSYLRQNLISLTISREPPLTDDILALAKYDYNETAVIPSEGAEPITALGGLNTDRMLLCTLPNGMWCRIAGNFNVPYEDMVTLMNSLLSDTSVLDEIDEGLASGELVPITREEYSKSLSGPSPIDSPDPDYDLLAQYNPVVRSYVPTPENNDYVPPISVTGADMEGEAGTKTVDMDVHSLDVGYYDGYDGRSLESYSISRMDFYRLTDKGMGELGELTRDTVESEYLAQKRLIDAQRSSGRVQPLHYAFFFTWDDYYVSTRFNEELTADGLWSFFQQLAGKEQAKGTDAFLAPE